jgi:hypothetical protein
MLQSFVFNPLLSSDGELDNTNGQREGKMGEGEVSGRLVTIISAGGERVLGEKMKWRSK